MEGYNVPEHGYTDTYLIQGADSNSQLTSPFLEQFEAMYNEGMHEFVVDQGLYYPTATNYGYICTGFDSPGDWDDHQRFLGQDGQDIQHAGARTENMPYVYYTPSYGYAQSPYNPYNPYIPGAMLGMDSPFLGMQQYYSIPSYETPASSPAYFPMVIQPRPDLISNTSTDLFMDSTASFGPRLKNNPSPTATTVIVTPSRPGASKTTLARISEGSEANTGPSKQPLAHGGVPSIRLSSPVTSQHQGKLSQSLDGATLHGKILSSHDQLKVVTPNGGGGLPNFGLNAPVQAAADKVRPRFYSNRVPNDVNGNPDALTEQNRGPRTNKMKDHLTVKAYTTKAGDSDAQGNIVINTQLYNRDDFVVDYVNAKFFVIKSYSEDDVHKSVKYNVWSSTPNGNKKLNSAYEDAQRIAAGEPKGCPVFLFFSVNASGQFCGVAEMIGPVDFYRDMDFWQQDKWSGCFPVKWHIIKDVPNPNFRHILLENNENKPVTNSRDTQEIRYKKGMDMLKIFKNYAAKTSLLDDFMYYESRQKMLQDEKARLLFKTFQTPVVMPVLEPHAKSTQGLLPSSVDSKAVKQDDTNRSLDTKSVSPPCLIFKDSDTSDHNSANANAADIIANKKAEDDSALKFSLLPMNSKQLEANSSEAAAVNVVVMEAEPPVDVVTVGSMPVKVNGLRQSSGFLTVGTIPLDPRSLQFDGPGGYAKADFQKG